MMQQQTTISRWCEYIIEAGWLLALSLIPIYFNLLSARHFEPDKATTLRALVLMMAAAALVRVLERFNSEPGQTTTQSDTSQANAPNPLVRLWRGLNNVPLAIPALLYALVFILTTITSVVPHTSIWGSYQRLQGTYTNLSYIGLFIIIVATLRRRDQFNRLIAVALLSSLVVAGYGFLQHLEMDPLPWRGDVITRVASTMGNSIFVAAYLIMIVPLALYWLITRASAARHAEPSENPTSEGLWALAQGLLIVGTLALLLSVIKFGAAVRVVDFRYWWVFPGAVMVSTALWVGLTYRPTSTAQPRVLLWPGAFFLGYMVFFGFTYALSAGSPDQTVAAQMTNALDWWAWMLASIVAISAFYLMALFLPARPTEPTRQELGLRAGGTLVLVLVLLAAIVFTQSRGPWIGLGAGLFVFFVMLLFQASRNARMQGNPALANRLRLVLGGWIALTLAVGGFLIAFNVSDAPVFAPLREVPYIGRMGELLEVESGTGRVRTLIWAGDEHAGGAIALITSDPLRTVIGWGPESMFVAYNPFYPPELANIESRGASPDRSHQAVLDELVTKGFLGLVTYVFLLVSFFALCWRLLRRSSEWHWQVFFIACISVVVSHFVEGLTGIPIVSTLTMFWSTLALAVVGGMLAGHYRIGEEPAAAPVEEATPAAETPEAAPPVTDKPKGKGKGKRGRGGARGAGAGAAAASSASARGGNRRGNAPPTSPAALGVYAIITVLTLWAVWWFNLSTVYADMRFSEGQSISQQGSGLGAQVVAMDTFIDSIRSNPREDFYYLNLGRVLMTIAQYQRVQEMPLGSENPDASVEDLLALNSQDDMLQFVQSTPPVEMLGYAEAVLRRARDLNDMNKDHYANLARLNNFWFNWTQDIAKLEEAADWYVRANEVAPQDVALLNEHAQVRLALANELALAGNEAASETQIAQATELLEQSQTLDPDYRETRLQLGELYRVEGNLEAAAEAYSEAIERNPQELDPYIDDIIGSFSNRPDLLLELRDAYLMHADDSQNAGLYSTVGLLSVRGGDRETAVRAYERAALLEPTSIENQLNYSIVLSDTQNYAEALDAARNGLALAEEQPDASGDVARLTYLVNLLESRAAGNQ